MATGALDANGIWQYGEDDSEPTFSGLLNKLAASTSTKVSSLKASDTTSGTFAAARIPNLQDLNGTLGIASGGTGVTTILDAQESYKIALLNRIPSLATVAGSGAGGYLDGNVGQYKFYSATAISLNGLFTSSYKNYKILITLDGTSTGSILNFRLRAGSTDLTAAGYNKSATTTNSAGATASYSAVNATSIGLGNAQFGFGLVSLEISHPAHGIVKGINYSMSGFSGSNYATFYGGAQIDNGATYDGFTIYPAAGNISGYIQVFAYND